MPRLYPPEFRQRAPGLVRSGRPVPGVATLLGIAVSWLVEQAPEYVALAQVRSLVLRAITGFGTPAHRFSEEQNG